MSKNARRRPLALNFDNLDRRDVPSALVAGHALAAVTSGHAGSAHVGSVQPKYIYVPPAGGSGTSTPKS